MTTGVGIPSAGPRPTDSLTGRRLIAVAT